MAGPLFVRRDLRHPGEMVNRWLGRPSSRRVKVATSLRWMHEVLGLERLHYGLWDGEPLTLDGLRSAQDRYSRQMQAWIPEGVRSILDVGCGVGTDARELTARGYQVEGLSPDPYQGERFVANAGLPFHRGRLQDYRPGRTYDLAWMSESAQYVWLEALFPKLREIVPGGWALIADSFRVGERSGTGARGHSLERFRERAAANGFEVAREEDVTELVLPTLELLAEWSRRYVQPSAEIVSTWLEARHPWIFPAVRRLAARPLGRVWRDLAALSPETFRSECRYLMLLLRAPGPSEGSLRRAR